ncbi:MAG: thioredoxin-dependent thiol peroxidase [Bacteroidetes bacterium]|jgi:peroxiredoxin Q/BCP|nr:thioredoxin-dependent thiol peroxidase [Bacteroidota bacterium]
MATSISPLKPGDTAPAFSAPDQHGNIRTLQEFQGKKLVLYFYPKDNTPGCTSQACNLNDNLDALARAGYIVLGVSPDSAKSHHKFIDKFSLKFDLLCDEDKAVHNAYGVWGLKKFMGREYDGTHRTTFVIDEEGRVERVVAKPQVKAHAEEILHPEP